MTSRILQLLQEPFPEAASIYEEMRIDACIGFFVFLFLFLFRPFGLLALPTIEAFKYTFIFGLMTFGVAAMFHFVRRYIVNVELDKPQWTFSHWLLSTFMLLFFIGIANFLFLSYGLGFWEITWTGLIDLCYYTFLVGMFPVFVAGFYRLNSRKLSYTAIADTIQQDPLAASGSMTQQNILLETDQGTVSVDLSGFLYAVSSQNYVLLYFVNQAGPTMIRSTLTNLQKQLKEADVIKVHRSYLVNPRYISQVTGNAQGLKLALKDLDFIVPVSRKYIQSVRDIQQ